ncbi:hypothetical protein Tco_0315533 [Tanacetum coccineum]
MELCTTLQKKVFDLEKTKTTQANEIASLKRRVKKLEKKRSSTTHKLKRLYKVGLSARVECSGDKERLGKDASKQGRINDIDADEDITLVNVQDDTDEEMYDVGTVTGDEVFAEQEVAAKDENLTIDEVALAQALAALKSVKPKVKGDVIEEPNVPVNAASASTKVSAATTTNATSPTPRKGFVITELVYLMGQCARKVAPIRSPTGIGAGLGEHLAPIERPDKFPIGDQGGFRAWFANQVWGWRVVSPPQTCPIAIPTKMGTPTIMRSLQQLSHAEV